MAKKKKKRKYTKRKKSKKAFQLNLQPATMMAIAQVVFFALAALIIISFSRRGLALVKVNDFLIGMFSWATAFLPFIFVAFGLLVSKIKTPLSQPNVVIGSLLVFVSIPSAASQYSCTTKR